MIMHENVSGTDWVRTYSDIGRNLLQKETGIVYGDSVIDHVSTGYTYEEVETGLEEEISDEEAYRIITDEDFRHDDIPEGELSPKEALDIILNRIEGGDEE